MSCTMSDACMCCNAPKSWGVSLLSRGFIESICCVVIWVVSRWMLESWVVGWWVGNDLRLRLRHTINREWVVHFRGLIFGIKFLLIAVCFHLKLVVECNLLSPLSVIRVRSNQRLLKPIRGIKCAWSTLEELKIFFHGIVRDQRVRDS